MSSIEGNSHCPLLLARCRSLFLWCSISDLCLSATCRSIRGERLDRCDQSGCCLLSDCLTSVLTFSVRVGLGCDVACSCGGLDRGCIAISCTLLACRRVPSDEPRDKRSTWSKMEDEERSSSGPLPEGAVGESVCVIVCVDVSFRLKAHPQWSRGKSTSLKTYVTKRGALTARVLCW